MYRDPKIKSSALWTILKDMVGQDITKFSMPVILNEPLTALQRTCEIFDANPILKQATEKEDSLIRMAHIATWSAARFFVSSGRI